jgi:hypothetical protein
MKRFLRKTALGVALLGLISGVLWQYGPFPGVFALTSLTDPAKLARLGPRGANPRLNKTVFWLHEVEQRGMSAATAIRVSQGLNGTYEPRSTLVRESLLRNLKIAGELGLLTPENLQRLRSGRAAVVTRGPYARSPAEVDHIVPYSLAAEVGNELANLEIMPAPLNRRKLNRVGERQIAHARRLHGAGLLSAESLARVEAHGHK